MPLPATYTQISINLIQTYFGYASGSQRSMSQLGDWSVWFNIPAGNQVRLSETFGGWYKASAGYY